MKKKVPFLCMITLIALLILSACTTTSSTTTAPVTSNAQANTTSAPATTSALTTAAISTTQPEAQKTITFNVAPGGMVAPPAQDQFGFTEMLSLIEQRTQGQVKFKVYWGQTLISQNQIATGIQSGMVDMAATNPVHEPGKLALAMIGQVPGIGSNKWVRSSAFHELLNQDPAKAELAKLNAKIVGVVYTSDMAILSKKPIRNLTDIKGMKVGAGGTQGKIVAALGATPVTLAAPDQYDALSKGVIESLVVPIDAIAAFKFNEIAKFYTIFPLGDRLYPVIFNTNAWNKISPENQKIIIDAAPDFAKASYEEFLTFFDSNLKSLQSDGVEIIELSSTDLDAVSQIENSEADNWALETDKAGQPGTQVMKDFRTLIEKYEKLNPY
ncbi:MAG: TRAP transporter substrate-binding protein DctP [Dehalococcoidales bacterium]|nr:TRAP transporter substrate-binding protein DctP [Dehalococcoidales bacterium]